MTVVICVRDPDASNDYKTFGGDVKIVDVDLGNSDLSDREQFMEWRESHLQDARELEAEGEGEAAEHLRTVVHDAMTNFGHSVEEPVEAAE